jgi:pentatricopeptide repeat protein
MKRENVTPNTVLLTTAINSLARQGGKYTQIASNILKDMETNGPEPNIYTYNTITRAYAEAGRLDEAVGVLRTLKTRSLTPDRYTFTTLFIACGRTNNSDKVPVIMNLMEEYGLKPDAIAYGAAIDVHRRTNNSLQAIECLHDMYRHDVVPTAAHFNLVLRTLKSEGYYDKMYRMVMAISSKDDTKVSTV